MNSTPDVAANLAAVTRLVTEAQTWQAKLLVLPECFAYLGPESGREAVAEKLPTGGPILHHCQTLAADTQMELILGGFWEQSSVASQCYNACLHLAQDGQVNAIYRKIHLFDADLPDGTTLRESDGVIAGDTPTVASTAMGPMGLSICYDVRFPELYRHYAQAGAMAAAIPAAFTLTTGKDHWHVLMRARAIENQMYILAAAQYGHHFGQRVSYGHALIVNPWGTILAQCSQPEGVAVAEINAMQLEAVRESLPCLNHRRLDVRHPDAKKA